jgi:hypothetical protein
MLRALMIGIAMLGGVSQALPARPRWPTRAVITSWVDGRTAPAGAAMLVERATATWTRAAQGRLTMRKAASDEDALVHIRFARADGIYGEALPRIDRRTGFITSAEVVMAADVAGDALQQQIVIYLTALHELGHALGLPHTAKFDDIMYSFRRPDDGERYFGAYRRRLGSAEDIGTDRATGLSPDDIVALHALYDR